jgi:hypothetical protein
MSLVQKRWRHTWGADSGARIWLLEPALPAMADEAGRAGAASVARGNDLPALPCLGMHDAIAARVSIEKDVEDAVCSAVLPELCGRLAAAEIG